MLVKAKKSILLRIIIPQQFLERPKIILIPIAIEIVIAWKDLVPSLIVEWKK